MRIQDSGRALAAGFDVFTTRATRSLAGVANTLSPAEGPVPIRDLLLDGELFQLIDETVAQIGLVLQKVPEVNGHGSGFHRLPTQQGPAALIQIPGEILSTEEKVDDVNLVSKVLRGHVRAVFVLTDAREINGAYKYVVWPSWTKVKERPICDVRTFEAQFLEFLKSKSAEERLEMVCDNFLLDRDPPTPVQLDPSDHERIADSLRDQALTAADSLKFLREVLDRLHVSNAAKGAIVGKLAGGDLNAASAGLVNWAVSESFPQGHELRPYTVVGRLLEVLHAGSGLEERGKLVELVERLGLIRDRAIISRLRSDGGEN